jgi:ABC-type antimicrobial peptide transport system permease subunit
MVGLAGGASLAAIAGARRASTSLSRFEREARAYDVFVAAGAGQEPQAFLDLLDSSIVAEHNDLLFVFVGDGFGFFFAPTSRSGLDVERGVLLHGRRADPDNPDEVVLSEQAARLAGVGVGATIAVPTLDQSQTDAMLQGTPPESTNGPTLQLHVVGVTRTVSDIHASSDTEALTILTPAFLDKYGGRVGVYAASHMVRLAHGMSDVDAFTEQVAASFGSDHLPSINVGEGDQSVADSITVIAAALVVLAAVVAIAGAVWIASTASRQMRLVERDLSVLRVLGVTRRERRVLLIGTVLPGCLVGLAAAPVLAVALSPAFPVGIARDIDPDVGLHVDAVALGLGMAVLLAVLVLVVALAGVRVGDAAKRDSGAARVPQVVDRTARALSPVPGTGVRFALYAPRQVSVPVRPALLGAAVGVVGLVAVAVMGSSLQRVVDTPARWGTTWDVAIGGPNDNDTPLSSQEIDRDALLAEPAVAAASVVLYDEQVTVNGAEAIAMTFEQVKGTLTPTIVDGHEPRAADEIALGRDTLDAAGASIGDTVVVSSRTQKQGQYRVTGVVVFPGLTSPTPVATGASFTRAGGDRLDLGVPNDSSDFGNYFAAIRWRPGTDTDAAIERLGLTENQHRGPVPPPEVVGLRDVERFPLVAAGALVVLGSIATTHALVVTVRRRRLELGVLSALGFSPRQRRAVISVQATTVALGALVIGVPLGVIAGRLVWSAIAASIGIATDARLPLALIAAGAAALVVVLNLIAAWPAHSARRLDVADALRSE